MRGDDSASGTSINGPEGPPSLQPIELKHSRQRLHLMPRGHVQQTDNLSLLTPGNNHTSLQATKQSLRIGQRFTEHRME